jgi:hypothetical protein
VRFICALTRQHAIDPDRGHELRVAAHSGDMSPADADAIIRELEALPLAGQAGEAAHAGLPRETTDLTRTRSACTPLPCQEGFAGAIRNHR